ncbi:MAG: CoA-binding protein [Bacteroidetes bacterium]|jgi:predicted CoA-binding protein|nr:CoA-binding protein [Bacteroidota bacterium]
MKTLVLGASENPERYSNKAVRSLLNHGHEVVPVGLKEGNIEGVKILAGKPVVEHVNTITMYVGPKNQKDYYDYVLSLKPSRIIFNPGAENPELEVLAKAKGIEVVEACTLVMLSIGNF